MTATLGEMLRRGILVVALAASVLVPSAARGAGFYGSRGGEALNAPIVGMAATSTGKGYWLAASDGGVFSYGDAGFFGSHGGMPLNKPIVGMAAAPDDRGYWLVASDGGIFAYGSAGFYGSRGGQPLFEPIVGMAATSDGGGYWLVASDGGVFAYGNAGFFGSIGGTRLNKPVVGMAARPQGDGYWMVANDGGVFAFGNAPFHGSLVGEPLASSVVGMGVTNAGTGYWLAADDGAVFGFNAQVLGSLAGTPLNAPIVAMTTDRAAPGYWMVARDGGVFAFPTGTVLEVKEVVGGLTIPWDIGFTPDGVMLFTERTGRVSAMVNGVRRTLAQAEGAAGVEESGLMGMAIDPGFATNRRIYLCQFYSPANDVRVYAWTVPPGYTSAVRGDAIVTGMPFTNGRHSGCRPRFGPDGMLWIGTGDGWDGTTPQNLDSLGGKVLRVKPDGSPAPGNPFNSRVYTYGHRNVQGLAWRPGTSQLYAVEHGTYRDDEINLVQPGGNGGWDPGPSYDEYAPMTDLVKFPGAMQAVWSSGSPTLATSGATFVQGAQWREYDGALFVACLRTKQLLAFSLSADGRYLRHQQALAGLGRLRTPVQGPDGKVYVTTSNGAGIDRIYAVTPP